MLFLQDVYSVVWLGKYDFTEQGVILFACPRMVHLPVERMSHMKEWVLSDEVWLIIYMSEVENYTRVDIIVPFYSLTKFELIDLKVSCTMSSPLQGDTLTCSTSFPELLCDLVCWDGAPEHTDASLGRR